MDLPDLAYARLSDRGIDLHLAAPATPLYPFGSGTAAPTARWHCTPDADLSTPNQAMTMAAPYPALVTIGHDETGAAILIDLENARALTVTGSQHDQLAVLRALLVELCAAQVADDLLIVAVGVGAELTAAGYADSLRLLQLDTLDEAIDILATWETTTCDALNKDGATSLHHARLEQLGSDLWTPRILLTAREPTPEQAERLGHILAGTPHGCTAAITTALVGDTSWTLPADNATSVLEPIGVELTAQRIDAAAYSALVNHLDIANDMTSVPAGDWLWPEVPEPFDPIRDLQDQAQAETLSGTPDAEQPVRPSRPASMTELATSDGQGLAPVPESARGRDDSRPEPVVQTPDASGTRAAESVQVGPGAPGTPTVRVLGPVDIQGAHGEVESSKTARLIELAAYLAVNPGRDHTAVTRALWIGGTTGNRNTAMSKLRRWLGNAPDCQPYLPRVEDDRYQFHPDVACDWTAFRRHGRRGFARADTEELAKALDLVRGQPFEGARAGRYGWAEHLRQEMTSSIVDAAARLAEIHLAAQDWAAAAGAAERGLRGAPGDEHLWRLRFRALHAGGDITGLRQALAELDRWNDAHDLDRDPETDELLNELLEPRARHVG